MQGLSTVTKTHLSDPSSGWNQRLAPQTLPASALKPQEIHVTGVPEYDIGTLFLAIQYIRLHSTRVFQ